MNQSLLRRYISIGLILVLIIIFSLSSPYFFSLQNFISLLREGSLIGIIAIGMTFAILTAGIDLSVGSTLAIVATVCADILRFTPLPVPLVLLISIAIGLLAGLINGLVIVKLGIPDFIVTLATMGIFRGLTLMLTVKDYGNVSQTLITNESFTELGGKVWFIYYFIIVFVVVAIIGHFLLKRTRFGTYVYAVGASPQSAALSGIKIGQIKILVYVISGLTCALASIMLTARMMTATPNMGIGIEFDVIAAVVIGGSSLNGGRGDIIGTVIGTLFMAILSNGIYQFQIPAAYQSIIKGLIILVAVIFDSWYTRHSDQVSKKTSWDLSGSLGQVVKP